MHVVLLGLMGSGKTSIGRRVADRLGRPLVDGDVVLAARTGGRTAAEIAEEAGVDALHALEADIAREALAGEEPAVIGPAASVVDVDDLLDAVAEHTLVWLTAPPAYLAGRALRKSHRPLLDDGDPTELFERQLAAREPRVRPRADLVIDVSTTTKDDAAEVIVQLVNPGAAAASSSPPPPAS